MNKVKLNIQMFSDPYVDFKDYPDTTTPIDSYNLNKIQTDARDEMNSKFNGESVAGNMVVESIRTKNLFNRDGSMSINGVYTNSTNNTITANANSTILCMPCKPNTTYTITRVNKGKRAVVCETTELPKIGTAITILGGGEGDEWAEQDPNPITTTSDAKYLIMWYSNKSTPPTYPNNNGFTEKEIRDGIQVEEGDTATSFKPHQNLDPVGFNAITAAASTAGDAYMTLTAESTNLLMLQELSQYGDSFEVQLDGGVKCLKPGVIEASVKVHWQSLTATGVKWVELWKNSSSSKPAQLPHTLSARGSIIIPPTLIEVLPGDVIYVNTSGSNGDRIRISYNYTLLFMKYVL